MFFGHPFDPLPTLALLSSLYSFRLSDMPHFYGTRAMGSARQHSFARPFKSVWPLTSSIARKCTLHGSCQRKKIILNIARNRTKPKASRVTRLQILEYHGTITEDMENKIPKRRTLKHRKLLRKTHTLSSSSMSSSGVTKIARRPSRRNGALRPAI